jgi:hypothetical protein
VFVWWLVAVQIYVRLPSRCIYTNTRRKKERAYLDVAVHEAEGVDEAAVGVEWVGGEPSGTGAAKQKQSSAWAWDEDVVITTTTTEALSILT